MIIKKFIALDLETTGFDFTENEIIEIGAVLFEDGQEKDTYSVFVKPQKAVPDFIKELTHISDADLKTGIAAEQALKGLRDFIGSTPLVCHNANFDIGFLQAQYGLFKILPPTNRVYDTLELARIYLPFAVDHKLGNVAELLQINLQNAHRAIHDSRATGLIFLRLTEYILKISLNINNQLYELAHLAKLNTSLADYLEDIINYQRKNALLQRQTPLAKKENANYLEQVCENPCTPKLEEIFQEGGLIQRYFAGYEYREGQFLMAEGVEQALRQEEFLLTEAGTGVGKSFAYLIPALKYAWQEKVKIVVSTNTKNLQEQLFYKDLPALQSILPFGFRAVLLKGRDNYICSRKWQNILFEPAENLSGGDLKGLLNLIVWFHQTSSGDISENNSFDRNYSPSLWKKLVADRYFCQGKRCAHFSRCFLMDIRKKSENASLIVVNHSLFLTDVLNDNGTIGKYDYLIIDEAHNLPHIASELLGITLGFYDAQSFLNNLFNAGKNFQSGILPNLKAAAQKSLIEQSKKDYFVNNCDELIKLIKDAKPDFEQLFKEAQYKTTEQGVYGKLRIKEKSSLLAIAPLVNKVIGIIDKLAKSIAEMAESLNNISNQVFPEYDDHLFALDGSLEQLQDLLRALFCLSDPDLNDHAYWLSVFEASELSYPRGVFNYAPLEVADLFVKHVYQKMKSVIFTSATLALRGSFKYFVSRMGLDLDHKKRVQELIVPSPFDYIKQTLVMAATFLPNPNDKFFIPQSLTMLKDAIITAKTGTLVLFTSYKDLNFAYDNLQEALTEKNIPLLAQGKGKSRTALLEEFKNHGQAVLFGTSSFWEGVDIKGESLSFLILYKIPFQVPSEPVIEAYLEKLEREGKNSFLHYMLPNALLKYKQGFGRLIRHKTDKGVVLILDNRIGSKDYGRYFQQILPTKTLMPKNPIEVIDYLGQFFKKTPR